MTAALKCVTRQVRNAAKRMDTSSKRQQTLNLEILKESKEDFKIGLLAVRQRDLPHASKVTNYIENQKRELTQFAAVNRML